MWLRLTYKGQPLNQTYKPDFKSCQNSRDGTRGANAKLSEGKVTETCLAREFRFLPRSDNTEIDLVSNAVFFVIFVPFVPFVANL
jgi:hypothetical protein